jgi:hypothetical protein
MYALYLDGFTAPFVLCTGTIALTGNQVDFCALLQDFSREAGFFSK